MTPGKLTQSFGNSGEQLDLLGGNRLRKGDNPGVLLGRNRAIGKLFEAVDQRSAKALQAVAIFSDRRALAGVQVLANLLAGMNTVIEVRNERGNRPLKVNVVLPERVVRVDQERLPLRSAAEEKLRNSAEVAAAIESMSLIVSSRLRSALDDRKVSTVKGTSFPREVPSSSRYDPLGTFNSPGYPPERT